MDSGTDVQSRKVRKKNKTEEVQQSIKSAVDAGYEKLAELHNQQTNESKRLADEMEFFRVIARTVAKMDEAKAALVRRAVHTIVFEASISHMENVYLLCGVRPVADSNQAGTSQASHLENQAGPSNSRNLENQDDNFYTLS